MAGERKPGSDQGRAVIDWQAAFVDYASLPPEQRCYRAVADTYEVSVRTVERHGRAEDWRRRADELDRAAAVLAGERLRDERAAKLVRTEQLVDASLTHYGLQLDEGMVKVTPADLARLHKLREQLWEHQDGDDRDETVTRPQAHPVDPTQRKLEVLRALDEAGVFRRLLDGNDDGRDDDADDQPLEREVA